MKHITSILIHSGHNTFSHHLLKCRAMSKWYTIITYTLRIYTMQNLLCSLVYEFWKGSTVLNGTFFFFKTNQRIGPFPVNGNDISYSRINCIFKMLKNKSHNLGEFKDVPPACCLPFWIFCLNQHQCLVAPPLFKYDSKAASVKCIVCPTLHTCFYHSANWSALFC